MPVSEESTFSGVARDNDNDVTRVDIEVLDTANGMIQVHSESVTEFDSNGEFISTWDSRALRHNSEYQIRMRSYDGFDYSEWKTVNIIADNPPDRKQSAYFRSNRMARRSSPILRNRLPISR